jgi:hypothetical protein
MEATEPYTDISLLLERGRYILAKSIKSIASKIPLLNTLPVFSTKNKRAYPTSSTSDPGGVPLNLKPGEWVQTRSADEIFATLDEKGKYRGLFFMPEMTKFCGKKFRVYKKVEKIMLESTNEIRKIMSPTVFLEGVLCDGEFHNGCDRACFCYWREVWLKRIEK